MIVTASEALERLRAGNRRYVAGEPENILSSAELRKKLAEGQDPFAVILGCADSRVPAELVFDQGLGDLFVIRVAGNIVAPSLIGSVEFAAANFGVRLAVVLGHTCCGAIEATVEELQNPDKIISPNLAAIVDRITPGIQGLVDADPGDNRERLIEEAVVANIQASVNEIKQGSSLLENLIKDDGLEIVGAEYSLETGKVHFLNNPS